LIFVVAWTIPFWLILFSFLIPGLTSLGQGAPLDGVPPGPLDEDPATPVASPFAGLIQSARFYLIFLLLVWVDRFAVTPRSRRAARPGAQDFLAWSATPIRTRRARARARTRTRTEGRW
jgi:hypothetical protein